MGRAQPPGRSPDRELTNIAVAPRARKEPKNGDTLNTVRRAALVLELFLDDTALSLTDVVRATGIGQTVAYRLLQTWAELDFLYFDRTSKRYRAGSTLLSVGSRMRVSLTNDDLDARLAELSTTLNCTSNVGILEGTSVLYIARRAVHQTVFQTQIGSRMLAHVTALGRAMLAFQPATDLASRYPGAILPVLTEHESSSYADFLVDLHTIERRGYATMNFFEVGTGSVAVPLRDRRGRVVAGLNVVAPSGAFTPDAVSQRIVPALFAAAERPIELPAMFLPQSSVRNAHVEH